MIERISDINELDEDTKVLCLEFLRICKEQGLNVRITETYRTQERQNWLYSQGRTREGKKVTWTTRSYHTTRRAFDICRNEKGREYDDSDGFFRKCAEIAKRLGLTCGYYWTNYQDKPHIQLDIGKKVDLEMVKKLKIKVNGKDIQVDAINKEGYNYIKLSDLAKLGLKVNFNKSTGDIEVQI